MKKTKWLETLKLWLGALLFFAESAVAGCRKLCSLPKRVTALCVALAMIVAILPVNILLANAEEPSSALPGARVETNDYGDVFLGGNYIEVGISKRGSFGTSRSPQTSGWHEQSGLGGIGLLSDADGWNVGEEPVTGDFFLPGTEEERWILAYEKDGRTYEHQIADRISSGNVGSWSEEPRTVNASDLKAGHLKAVVTGITSQDVKIIITYSFGVNDLYYTTDVAITNLGDSSIENVRFVRSFDPDQDQAKNNAYETYNKVICNPDSAKQGGKTNYALVVARGKYSLAGYFFITFDNRARASWGYDLAPGSAYNPILWDSAPVTEKTYATDEALAMDTSNTNGYVSEDGLIALTFNIGTLSAKASTTLQYQSSLDPDVQGSLQKVLSGNVDYAEEVLTGFTAGSNYHITCGGVTYVFENIPDSTIPLAGTAPTTADPTSVVAYDFLGKTITIVEVDGTGQDASEEQDLTIAPRPGEMQPGETLPEVPAPVIENITTTLKSITIDPAVEIQEYSLDGQNWIRPTDGKIIFTGLEDGTGYTVYTRVAATSEYPASQICSLLVYTDAYKVTLDYGALGSEVTYAQASGKLDLDIPVFDGYIFMGWYDDANFTMPHDFTIGIEGDITLYAKFADYKVDLAKLTSAIDAAKAELQTKIDAKADTATVNAAIAELEEAIEALEAAKDNYVAADAALKTELEGKISAAKTAAISAAETLVNNAKAELQSKIDAKADTATVNAAIAELEEAIEALEAAKDNYVAADAALKTELEGKIATAKDEAISAAETLVNNAKTELQSKIDAKANTADVNAAIANLQAAIDALEAVKDDYATADATLKTELEGKIATAKSEAISAAETLVNNAKTELQNAINAKADTATLNEKVDELNDAIATAETVAKAYADAQDAALKSELEAAIATAKSEAITSAETLVNNAKTELQNAINAKADTATLNEKVEALNTAITNAETVAKAYADAQDATLMSELETAIATAKGELEALIGGVQDNLDKAKAELDKTIADLDAAVKAGDKNLSEKITALNTALTNAKAAFEKADADNKAELVKKIEGADKALDEAIKAVQKNLDDAKAELTAAINNKADTATLNTKIDELNAAIATAEATAKAYTDGAAAALTTAIATAKSEAISAAETLVNNAKIELQSAIDTKADAATVNAAIANLQNAITALENAKDNYVSADAALKAELEAAIAKAKQEAIDAAKGHIPYIGTNGNWWIGDTDTGVDANGIQGEAGKDGKDGITPKLRINSDNIWEVSYDNGATWESLGISAVGTNGTNGITPKLRVNDKNIWEVSYDGGNTWESLGISAVGTNGTNGTNGKDGADGKNGADGKAGANGKDGITPKLRINSETNMWEVSYDGGKTWESLGVSATGATGADGKDGVTPQLRINGDINMWEVSYDGGATWTSMGVVATGADGKDGSSALPIVISCISLAGMAAMFVMMMSDRKKRAFAGKH